MSAGIDSKNLHGTAVALKGDGRVAARSRDDVAVELGQVAANDVFEERARRDDLRLKVGIDLRGPADDPRLARRDLRDL